MPSSFKLVGPDRPHVQGPASETFDGRRTWAGPEKGDIYRAAWRVSGAEAQGESGPPRRRRPLPVSYSAWISTLSDGAVRAGLRSMTAGKITQVNRAIHMKMLA